MIESAFICLFAGREVSSGGFWESGAKEEEPEESAGKKIYPRDLALQGTAAINLPTKAAAAICGHGMGHLQTKRKFTRLGAAAGEAPPPQARRPVRRRPRKIQIHCSLERGEHTLLLGALSSNTS